MQFCSACGQAAAMEAKFCNACGMALTTHPIPSPERPKWYHNMWFVLLMLTPFALGPFALPLLWKSPAFSKNAKWWLTLGTLLWTALFVAYIMQHVVPAVMNELRQLNTVFSPM